MTTALDKIIAYKEQEVADLKAARSLASLEEEARAMPTPRDFSGRIARVITEGKNAIICEIKRRSPSAGLINALGDPIAMAQTYEAGGAACLSVLTDGPSFGGSAEDLISIRREISLPVLRKDFMIDPIQVIEARAMGADAILVIMAAVHDALASDLHDLALELGMSVLVEVHNEEELKRALNLSSPLLGVNNRNLKTFETDLAVTETLSALVPEGKILISESGVKTVEDVSRLRTSHANGFLVGESLMRSKDVAASVKGLVEAR